MTGYNMPPPATKIMFVLSILTMVNIIIIIWYQQKEVKKTPLGHFKNDLPEENTLEGLHQKIWKQIRSLQEEGNCEEKKIMHCENIGSYAGLGSMVMRYGACMQVAFALGRMFFIQQKEYKHFGGLFRFLKDESSRCGYIKDTYRLSNSVCNMHNRSCYLENGYEIDNSYKVLEYNSNMRFPAPRRIPGTIPLEIEQKLTALKIEEPWLWFTSQFLGYLMLRLKPEVIKLMNSFKKGMNFAYPLVSIHIRHGVDKLNHESRHVKEENYLSTADKYYNTFLPNMRKCRVYIASDNKYIMTSLKHIRPNYEFLQLPREYVNASLPRYKVDTERLIYKRPNFPKEVIESIIIEMHFLVYSNYSICSLSSNVCRLVWSLKLSTPPYRIDNRIFSVDHKKKLNYYWWFGYTAPFHRYWIPTRSSSINVTFSDGSNMMHYFPGMLFNIKDRMKIMTVNDTVYNVIYASTVYRFADTRKGYVFTKDIVKWPGRPSYHFYN